MTRKLKPIPVNQTQMKRLLKEKIGIGFFMFRAGETSVGVIPMCIDDSGAVLDDEGNPLEYLCEDGETITYRVEKITSAAIEKLNG